MSILKKAAQQLRGEIPIEERDNTPVQPVQPAKRGRSLKVQRIEAGEAFEYVNEEESLVRVRRRRSEEANRLIEEVFAEAGEAVPMNVEFFAATYRVRMTRKGPAFDLVEWYKPPWHSCRTERDPPAPKIQFGGVVGDELPFCYDCAGRLFWRDVNGSERCALCRPPRLDAGYDSLFKGFFLRAGLKAYFGERSANDLDF
jgi:hypothetical protein